MLRLDHRSFEFKIETSREAEKCVAKNTEDLMCHHL